MYSLNVFKVRRQVDFLLLSAIFVTFIVAMNFVTYHLGGAGLTLSFNNTTWILFSFILLLGVLKVVVFNRIVVSKIFIAYLTCLGVLLFPIVYTSHDIRIDGFMVIAAIFASLALLFIIEQNQNRIFKHRVLCILYISTLIQTLWGLIQYYFIFEPSLLFPRADIGSPYGAFSQKNVFATYLAFGSLLAIYFLFHARNKTKLLVISTFLVVTANAHLSMLAEAKTGRVVPIIAVVSYLIYCAYRYGYRRLTLSLLVVCIIASFTPKQWFDVRPGQKIEGYSAITSLGLRPIMYKLGVKMVLDQPVNGYGIGNVAYEFLKEKSEYQQSLGIEPVGLGMTEHIHNEPLQWALQFGVLSGLAFVFIFVVWCVGLFKGWLDPAILLLALPFVGHALLELPFYHSVPHLLAFVTVLGLATNQSKRIIKFPSILGAIILPLISFISYKIVGFMLLSLSSLNVLVEYRMGDELDKSLLYSVEPTSTFKPFFEHEKHEWRFKEALQTGTISQKETFDFIGFLERYRIEAPQSILYIQLAELYNIAGQNAKAESIMQEARFLFPEDEKIKAYFSK